MSTCGLCCPALQLCLIPAPDLLSSSPYAGFDPFLDPLPLDAFAAALAKSRKPIKALLLDQSFSAGVGNWGESIRVVLISNLLLMNMAWLD